MINLKSQFQNASRLQRDSKSRKAIRLRRINHKNTWSISKIALKVSADASLRVTKVPKFSPDVALGQISADFERGCFETASYGLALSCQSQYEHWLNYG